MPTYKCETLVHHNIDVYVEADSAEEAMDAANEDTHRVYPDAILIDVQGADLVPEGVL